MMKHNKIIKGFGERLKEKIKKTKPLCVGIDPSENIIKSWGLKYLPDSIEKFSKIIIDNSVKKVPAIKPQSAFYEAFGSNGIKVLEKITHYAHKKGLFVILDVKRGDISSTMSGYSKAFLYNDSPIYTDAITLNPFLGFDSLLPSIEIAESNNKGIFILVKTSNIEGNSIQTAMKNNKSISENLIENISNFNKNKKPIGNVGAVIGTTNKIKFNVSKLNGYILAPGIGAQGGFIFKNVNNVLYSASRSITKNSKQISKEIEKINV